MEYSVLKEKSVKCSRSIKILALACLVLSLVSLLVSSFQFKVYMNVPKAYQRFESTWNSNPLIALINTTTVVSAALFTVYVLFFYKKIRMNGLIASIFFIFFSRATFLSAVSSTLRGYHPFRNPLAYWEPFLFLCSYGPLFCLFGIGWSLKRFNRNKGNLIYTFVTYMLTEGIFWFCMIYNAIRNDVYRPRYNFLAPVVYDTVTYVLTFASVAFLCFAIHRFVTTHTVFSVFLPKYSERKGLNHRQAVVCRKLDRMHESGLLNYQEYCAACDEVVEQYK